MVSRIVETFIRQGEGVAFTVEHLPTDSYSRSVRRAARKALRESGPELRKAGWPGRGPLYEGRWTFDLPAPEGRCRTLVPFTYVRPTDFND